jgi:hypothetical protein
MATKRPREIDLTRDSDNDERKTKVAHIQPAPGPFASFLPELWGEVAQHMPMLDQIRILGCICKATRAIVFPLKGNSAEFTPLVWARLCRGWLYFDQPGLRSQRVQADTGPTADELIAPHSLIHLTGLRIDARQAFIASPAKWIATQQTNVRSLCIESRLGDVYFARDAYLIALLGRITDLRIRQSQLWFPSRVGVQEGKGLTNLRRLVIDGCVTTWDEIIAVDDAYIKSIPTWMPSIESLSISRITAIGDWAGLELLTNLKTLDLRLVNRSIMSVIESMSTLVDVRVEFRKEDATIRPPDRLRMMAIWPALRRLNFINVYYADLTFDAAEHDSWRYNGIPF